ncbi:MAG: aa3-type cytochrome oxidase subunit II [Nocardioidaceae bacterium]
MLLVAVPVLLVLSGCSKDSDNSLLRLALPPAASDRTSVMFNLWLGGWIASAVVFALVFGLIVWSMIRYRRRSDDEVPTQLRYHLPIEVLYTIAPIIVVAVFFFHTVEAQNTMLKKVDNPDHSITVVGSQWQWTFDYTDEEATGGDPVFDYGTPDDFAELWLPVGESVRFDLKSPDVIHSFWIPEFYFKMDVFPGKVNSFDLTPTRKGVFTGRCAELCGLYHSRMLFKVHVVSPEEYDAHMRDLKKAGQVGTPEGGEDAMQIAGQTDESGATQ